MMLTIPKVAGLAELLSIFSKKMREMGIGTRVLESKESFRIIFTQDELGAGRAISHSLKQVLEYCFEKTCHFDRDGQVTFGEYSQRPQLSSDDVVYLLYKKWQLKNNIKN